MNLYICMYFTVYAFTIHGCLAPLPTRDERGSVSTVQSVFDRMSRNLQGIRRTIEMNPSLETLRRVLGELRHLLRNVERLRSEIPLDKYNQMHSAIGTVTSFVENSIKQQEQPRTAINNTSHSSRSSADIRPRIPRQNEGKVGPPKVKIDRAKLERLLDLGFTVRQIAKEGLLSGKVHYNTIHTFMKKNGIPSKRQRYSTISDVNLDLIVSRLSRQFPNAGSEEIHSHLRTQSQPVIVQRARCRAALQRVDPMGTARRWAQAISRRSYHVPTPNSLWHVDSNHALIR